MGDFDHLAKLDIKDKTAKYEVVELDPSPILIVKHAGESNKPFFNSMLKKVNQNERKRKSSKNAGMTSKQLEDARNEDREEYPKTVIVGWENTKNSKGKPVEFSVEKCKEFLDAMPNYMFDDLRVYCGDYSNFTDPVEAEEIAKNSQTA